jgi:hypothetical protein
MAKRLGPAGIAAGWRKCTNSPVRLASNVNDEVARSYRRDGKMVSWAGPCDFRLLERTYNYELPWNRHVVHIQVVCEVGKEACTSRRK